MLGIEIVESFAMVENVEDWSRVRSPGRARRRRHKHRQNIELIQVPRKDTISADGGRTIIMHPVTALAIRQHISKEFDRRLESVIMGDTPAPEPGILSVASLRAGMVRSPWDSPLYNLTVTS